MPATTMGISRFFKKRNFSVGVELIDNGVFKIYAKAEDVDGINELLSGISEISQFVIVISQPGEPVKYQPPKDLWVEEVVVKKKPKSRWKFWGKK